MGVSFEGRFPANIWGDILQISNNNTGADPTLRNISDGRGDDTPLQLSTLTTRVKANTDGQVFDVCNVAGDVMLSVNTITNKITAGDGVTFTGDGGGLTGIGGVYAQENEIQPAGSAGAGVGYTLEHPSYMVGMDGYMNPHSPNFGNYYDVVSGSIMVYIPKHYVKITTDNIYTYKSIYDYDNETLASNDGYFLPRCFIDGDEIVRGYFRDKYPHNSIENNVAVSKKNMIPITSSGAVTGYGFANCTANGQTPTNNLGGSLAVAKSRGDDFYNATIFHDMDLFFIAKAHSRASTATYCAYKDVLPYFPKGNNNNALRDANDVTVFYTTAGNADYAQRALAGSGVPFAKTTHNGQECGIADLNGNISRPAIGLTSDGTDLYVLKESIAFKDLINSTSDANGAFNITNFDSIGANPSGFTQINGTAGYAVLGNGTNQVFSGETDRTQLNYKMTNVGLPLPSGYSSSGTDDFGKDGIYVPTAFPNHLCVLWGLYWAGSFQAGLLGRFMNSSITTNGGSHGTGACLSNV